ncbi:MAG: GILT family protein [Polyangia bacterium]
MKLDIAKTLFAALGLVFVLGCGEKKAEDESKKEQKEAVGEKVALDFHIMSKCPFGVKVMQAITPVLEKMGDNIDFNVYYIGKKKNGELTSMHGEKEVMGNKLQLCAEDIGDFDQWLSFVKCMNDDWRKIPEGWEQCAESSQLDVAKMKACAEGEQGEKLLAESFAKSREKKATGSPTIFLGDEPYRGGRSEHSFGRAICAVFEGEKPAYCDEIPAPVKVPVTVVADKRCKGRGCDPKRFLAFITHTFEGAEIKELDYSDEEGKKLFEKSDLEYLPIAVFGPEVEKEEAGYNRLKRRLKPMEGSDELVYPLGRKWDPTAEICDDGKDNTGNGKVDCEDESCQGKKVCREEIPNKLDLFAMSQCPYGVRTVDAMQEVLENFGKDRGKIDFSIEFIGRERDGRLTSMHGQGEVDEDKRQLCAQKHYGKNYKFMDYVLCRNEAYRKNRGKEPQGNEWVACATGGINAEVIRKCAEGEEGEELLAASFQKASDLGITGSPNWLLNNKFEMHGRNAEAIKNGFCAKNEGLAGCEKELSSAVPGRPSRPSARAQRKPGKKEAGEEKAAEAEGAKQAGDKPAAAKKAGDPNKAQAPKKAKPAKKAE